MRELRDGFQISLLALKRGLALNLLDLLSVGKSSRQSTGGILQQTRSSIVPIDQLKAGAFKRPLVRARGVN